MQKTAEEIFIDNRIEKAVQPLKKEIERLQKIILKTEQGYRSEILEDVLKKIPLATRFKAFLEMEYLHLTVKGDICCTELEAEAAHAWALMTTEYLLRRLKEWERDGRPEEEKTITEK